MVLVFQVVQLLLLTAANVHACMFQHSWPTSTRFSYSQTSQLQRQQLILITFTYLHTLVINVPVAWSDHSIVDPNRVPLFTLSKPRFCPPAPKPQPINSLVIPNLLLYSSFTCCCAIITSIPAPSIIKIISPQHCPPHPLPPARPTHPPGRPNLRPVSMDHGSASHRSCVACAHPTAPPRPT